MQISTAESLKRIVIDAESMGRLAECENELVRIDERISRHPLRPAISHQLLRLESIASAIIDGSPTSFSDLMRFEAVTASSPKVLRTPSSLYRQAQSLGLDSSEGTVVAYLYQNAIMWISENIPGRESVPPDLFQEIFSRFDANEIARIEHARREQSCATKIASMEDFAFLSEARMQKKLDDYISFVNSNSFSPSAQAELSHAILQSVGLGQRKEDGYERALSHVILYRRGVLTKSVAPLAVGPLIDIARHAESIYQNMSKLTSVESEQRAEYDFADTAFCTSASAKTMHVVMIGLANLRKEWLSALGLSRGSNKAAVRLVDLFLEHGCLTVDTAASAMEKSFSTASAAMHELVSAGLAREAGHANKRHLYRADAVVDFLDSLLSKLSSNVTVTRDQALAALDIHPPCKSDDTIADG